MSQVEAMICQTCMSPALILVILSVEPPRFSPYCPTCKEAAGPTLKPEDPNVTARTYGAN